MAQSRRIVAGMSDGAEKRDDGGIGRMGSPGRLAAQVVGAVVGLGLFAWAVRIAMSPENAATVEKLRGASGGVVGWIVLLTVWSLVMNGLVFWWTLRTTVKSGVGGAEQERGWPGVLDVVAANMIATFLSVLPFKLGLIVRLAIHRKRDGVPVKALLAFLVAASAVALGVLVPVGLVGVWRKGLDAWFVLGAVVGPAACLGIGFGLARVWAKRVPERLRAISFGAERVFADWRMVFGTGGLRVVDIASQCARFGMAAQVAGIELSSGNAVVLGATYFLIGVLAPAGAIGFAEIGTGAVAMAIGLDKPSITTLALVLTVVQTVVTGIGSVGGAGWLWLGTRRRNAGV